MLSLTITTTSAWGMETSKHGRFNQAKEVQQPGPPVVPLRVLHGRNGRPVGRAVGFASSQLRLEVESVKI